MKYQIYDNVSDVITPSGKVFTAEEWLAKYPWAKTHKMIISTGVINGAVAYVFDDYVNDLKNNGVDFSECKCVEDYLRKIEEFEDGLRKITESEESVQERIANALEDLVVLQMPNVEE